MAMTLGRSYRKKSGVIELPTSELRIPKYRCMQPPSTRNYPFPLLRSLAAKSGSDNLRPKSDPLKKRMDCSTAN